MIREGGKEEKMEKNYFLAGREYVSPFMMGRLQEVGIDFVEMKIDGAVGVVVDEENLLRALKVLGAEVEAEYTTSYEGIVRVELRTISEVEVAAEPEFQVEVKSWDGKQSKEFVRITEQVLLPVVKENIFLHVPHKHTRHPVEKDFQILIWSAPDGSANTKPPAEMWGVRVDCRDDGYAPSGQGVPIYDDSGWPVAELVGGNNLYIFHDICHKGTDRELEIYRHILEEVVAELTLTPEQKAERQRKLAEARRQRSREQYIAECSKRLRKTLEDTRKKISDGEREIEELQKRLVRKIREVAGARRKLEQLQSCQSGELERYGKEFDKLLEVSKVVDVQVVPGMIKVFTDTLYCTDPRSGKVHEIGSFCIEIYTDGANGGVKWFNLTRKVDGGNSRMNAPHVNSEGKACFGNTAEIFAELIASYEFAACAMVAIQFIESVNTDDDWGRHIDRWPLAPAEMQPLEVREEVRRLEELRTKIHF